MKTKTNKINGENSFNKNKEQEQERKNIREEMRKPQKELKRQRSGLPVVCDP